MVSLDHPTRFIHHASDLFGFLNLGVLAIFHVPDLTGETVPPPGITGLTGELVVFRFSPTNPID